MKKVLLAVLLIALCITSAQAWTCKSSGLATSSTVLKTTGGTICGVLCIADGTNAATCTIYDNTAASGTVLWKSTTAAGDYLSGGLFPNIIRSNTGAYISLSGTGANAIVYYDAQ